MCPIEHALCAPCTMGSTERDLSLWSSNQHSPQITGEPLSPDPQQGSARNHWGGSIFNRAAHHCIKALSFWNLVRRLEACVPRLCAIQMKATIRELRRDPSGMECKPFASARNQRFVRHVAESLPQITVGSSVLLRGGRGEAQSWCNADQYDSFRFSSDIRLSRSQGPVCRSILSWCNKDRRLRPHARAEDV